MFWSFWPCSYVLSHFVSVVFTARAPLAGWLHKTDKFCGFSGHRLLLPLLPPFIALLWSFTRTGFILFSAADKYCPLLIKEGGIPLLKDMIKMASARQETKEMAR